MNKITIIVTFSLSILLLQKTPALAQQGNFGSCTRDQVLKFIDVGLSKNEIVNLCTQPQKSNTKTEAPKPVVRPKPVVSRAKPKPRPKPIIKKTVAVALKGKLSDLDGTWSMNSVCSPYSGYAEDIVVRSGNFTGTLHGGGDSLGLRGSVSKDGKFQAYGNGTHVFAEFNGTITDWKTGLGKGEILMGGEADCVGTWTITRKKN
jgi:hypothetical protein